MRDVALKVPLRLLAFGGDPQRHHAAIARIQGFGDPLDGASFPCGVAGYRSKVIKQADVLALLGVFPYQFTAEQKAASFKYYEPFTIHDSSNSLTHRQMVAADLGWADVAYESWLRAIDIDFGKPPRSNDGLHYANVGGMWQQVVFGFGGLASALNQQCLVFKPCLPEQIQSITFPLTWKGQALRVTQFRRKPYAMENLSQSTLEFGIGGQKFEVEAGQSTEAGY